MFRATLRLAAFILAAAAVTAWAAPQADHVMINVYQQMAPWQAYYNARTDWPRAHGYKPFKRYEWDMRQRGWPDGNVPAGALWEAFQQRQRMGRATLDEPWVNLGPYNHGGRARVIRFHPDNPDIMFCGAVSGGLWKSLDAGETWFPLTENLPNLAVGCFEIDLQHPDTMYLGTGEGYYNGDAVLGIGLLKSTDGGNSWGTTGLSYAYNQGQSILKINIDPRNSDILLVSTNNALYRSTDGGQSFVSVQPGDVKALARDPQNPDVLLCAPGNPWGSNLNGVYRSTDNGVTWTRSSDGLPDAGDIGRTVLAFYPSNTLVVYAGLCGTFTYNGSQMIGIYRSLDNGQTWTLMSRPGTNHYASQGWYDMALAVKPDESNVVFSSGLDINRSRNSGASWTRLSWWYFDFGHPQYVHADHHEIVFHPTHAGEVWEVTDGGIFKSTDLGDNWVEMNNGFVTFQYYAMGNATLDTAVAYGGTQDNGTFRYAGDPAFEPVYGGDGGYCVVDPTNSDVVYVEWQNGHRYRSDDGGFTFESINPGITGDGPWVTPMVLDPFDHLTIYTTTTNGWVWKSPNQGRNSQWQTVGQQLGGDMQVLDVSSVVPGRIYLGTSNNVFRHDEGTEEWVSVTGNLPNAWMTRVVPDPYSGNTVYVTLSGFSHGHVWKSTQAGGSWQNISGNLPDVPFQDVVVDRREPSTLYAGGDIGVYRSTDGGASWQILGEDMPAARVDDMELQTVTGVLRASTHGRGMWEIQTGAVGLAMLYPNGGELLEIGQPIDLRWSGVSFGGHVTIDINRTYPSSTWQTIAANTLNDGMETWTVTGPESDHVRFRIATDTNPVHTDSGNADCRIVQPRLDLVWPNGGETVLSGVRDTVRFSRLLVPELLVLTINRDYPSGTWEDLVNAVDQDSTAYWIVHLPASDHARLRIASSTRPQIADESDADFVLRAPQISLTAPNGGEQIPVGSPYQIQWSAPEHRGNVRILLNRDYPDGSWELIASNTQNDGAQSWTPTPPASSNCRVKIATVLDAESYAVSAADFALTPSAADERPELPAAFVLHEPYPNPFNPLARITLELPIRSLVEARVYNRLGQEVAVLANETFDPGRHQLTFDGSAVPSGLYFIRVNACGQERILKAALVK